MKFKAFIGLSKRELQLIASALDHYDSDTGYDDYEDREAARGLRNLIYINLERSDIEEG